MGPDPFPGLPEIFKLPLLLFEIRPVGDVPPPHPPGRNEGVAHLVVKNAHHHIQRDLGLVEHGIEGDFVFVRNIAAKLTRPANMGQAHPSPGETAMKTALKIDSIEVPEEDRELITSLAMGHLFFITEMKF